GAPLGVDQAQAADPAGSVDSAVIVGQPATDAPPPVTRLFPTWQELVRLPNEDLRGHDIAAVNLACAAGLPGAENLDALGCLQTLDTWAQRVRQKTAQAWPAFVSNPGGWDGSPGIFRIHCLLSVLQLDCGVRYNPDKMAAD